MSDRFQILALDGGGLRGMFGAAVLARLEEDLDVRITDHFDLIAGTSTGGIIAIGLGLGLSPRQIVEFYVEHGPRIFRDRTRTRGVAQLLRAKYGAEPLQEALHAVFGTRTFGESRTRLVIPSWNLGEDDVYLFRTPHLPHLTRDWRELAADVALATTAAPTYLPAHDLGGIRLVDGGVWANNPSMAAVVEAVGPLALRRDAVRVLSLGTTTDVARRPRRLDRGGLLPWAGDVVDVLLRAQSTGVAKQVRHLLGAERVLRIDPVAPTGLLSLDRVDAAELVGRAAHASRIHAPDVAELFTGHRAPPYTPHHRHRES